MSPKTSAVRHQFVRPAFGAVAALLVCSLAAGQNGATESTDAVPGRAQPVQSATESLLISELLNGSYSEQAVDLVLETATRQPAIVLREACRVAIEKDRVEDAAFLYYAAEIRDVSDQIRFPPASHDADGPFTNAGVSGDVLGRTIEKLISRTPSAYISLADRIRTWSPASSPDYTPQYEFMEHVVTQDDLDMIKMFEVERRQFLYSLASLMENSDYRAAFRIRQAFRRRAEGAMFLLEGDPAAPTLGEAVTAHDTMRRIEIASGFEDGFLTAHFSSRHARNRDETWSITDVHCSVGGISAILTREESEWTILNGPCPKPFLVSRRQSMWLLNWQVGADENATAPAASYLGSYREYRPDAYSDRLDSAGHPASAVHATGFAGRAAIVNAGITIVEEDGAEISKVSEPETATERSNPWCIWSRDGRHVLVCSPEPAILSLPGLDVVHKLERNAGFHAFRDRYEERRMRSAFLTDDLSSIILRPFADSSAERQDTRSDNVYHYDINSDTLHETIRTGHESGVVLDAAVVNNGIHWLLSTGSGKQFTIVDSMFDTVSEFSLPKIAVTSLVETFWDTRKGEVWLTQAQIMMPTPEYAQESLLVYRISTDDGSHVRIRLPAGDLPEPGSE